MNTPPFFEVRHLHKSFDGAPCLKDVSFSVNKGELLAVVGKNDSSKTILMNSITGVVPLDHGDIFLNSHPVSIKNPSDAHRLGIRALRDTPGFCDHLTVTENLFLERKTRQYQQTPSEKLGIVTKKSLRTKFNSYCRYFDFRFDPQQKMQSLGLAERQMLAFVQALLADPHMLIIDNAFSALSKNEILKIHNIIDALRKRGTSIIYLTHSFDEVSDLADSLIVLHNGAVKGKISSAEIKALGIPCANDTPNDISAYPKLATVVGKTLLACEGLCYKNIIQNVSFDIHEGEIVGIIGATGSGRTTLARVMFGDLKKDGGHVYLHDHSTEVTSPYVACKNGLSLVLDNREKYSLLRQLDLTNNLIFPNYNTIRRQSKGRVLSMRNMSSHASKIAEHLGIRYGSLEQRTHELSAGNQQKVILARGIVRRSDVFLLDEPTRSIDKAGKIQIYNIFNELVRMGKGILFITSDIYEAMGMCDRLLIVNAGRITHTFKRDSFSYDCVYNALYPTDPITHPSNF